MRWSQEDVAALHRYAVSGVSLRDTAHILGRTVNDVLSKMVTERIGFTGPPGAPFANGHHHLTSAAPAYAEHSTYHAKVGFCRACGVRVDDVFKHYREAHRPSR
jgi:hypothetical protein